MYVHVQPFNHYHATTPRTAEQHTSPRATVQFLSVQQTHNIQTTCSYSEANLNVGALAHLAFARDHVHMESRCDPEAAVVGNRAPVDCHVRDDSCSTDQLSS